MTLARAFGVLVLSAALLAGSTGCAMRGIGGMSQTTEKTNLELQRESALKFRSEWSQVEMMRFTQEGSRPGFGAPWSVNAVATVAGVEYQVIIGPTSHGGFPTGDVPPDAPVLPTPEPMTVIYSNGTSEVLP
ncbi:hypothetical protein AB4Z18_14965 [Leifsonia sp. 2TAF2]|uniref:hypothetical protein n=1 Tax=Leifsonia sp. 2TAF2 TaxID=3233009 RepID=UPI003F9B97D5